jgi:CubicO group peptidase (beta-lactamase class C family)
MQLVNRQLIDLDDPVNDLLRDFQVDSPFAEPIRVRHLLTHTAGLDDALVGIVDDGSGEPLGRSLARHLPPVIAPPGELWLYSNHGIALAGHLVEVVTGQRFEDYVANNIFQPLGMTSSTFARTAEVESALATGYDGAGRPWRPGPIRLVPAAGLTTTGNDLATYMLAHLEGGRGLVSAETMQSMHSRQFSLHPDLPGMALGFYEKFHHGVRELMHDGDWTGYSHRMALIPDERLGVFVSFNAWRLEARVDAVRAVLDAFVPPPGTERAVQVAANADVAEFGGTYWWNRYPHRGLMKIVAPKMESVITHGEDGIVDVSGMRFAPSGDGAFRRIDGPGRLRLLRRENGISRVLIDVPFQMGPLILEPIPWYGTTRFQRTLAAALRAIAATALIWPIAAAIAAIRRRTGFISALGLPWLVASVAALPVLLSPFWLAATLSSLPYGISRSGQLLLLVPAAATVLAAATGWYQVAAWRSASWLGRIHYTAVWLAMVTYLWVLDYWNLLTLPPAVTR